ncbi:LuxR C-terminal-related transcriptional regulator [Streptomyces sp. NPDC055722]
MTDDQRTSGRRGYGHQLSPKELQVVELLLRSLSNREIAVALSRSPTNVAAQLNSAMRKHGGVLANRPGLRRDSGGPQSRFRWRGARTAPQRRVVHHG